VNEASATQPLPSDEERLRAQYSIIVSAWGSYQSARNTLLSGYLVAHSFLITATVLLFVHVEDTGLVGELALLLFSIVGLLLALQLALAWFMSMNRVFLFEWHLRQLEKDKNWKGPKLFMAWGELREHPKRNACDPSDTTYANWATKLAKKWWARRAQMIPILLAALYFFFLIVAILAWRTHGTITG
jgi:hypothetical protein